MIQSHLDVHEVAASFGIRTSGVRKATEWGEITRDMGWGHLETRERPIRLLPTWEAYRTGRASNHLHSPLQ